MLQELTCEFAVQSVMSSAQSLSDITDERVVPVDYLGVLILLFLFMVLDRLFYTLGLHVGKVLFFLFIALGVEIIQTQI